jgi:tryptophanyl-tRNA synthetase
MAKEVVVSGIRSTGHLHLGNYFGAMRNYVTMQDEYNCYFFVADYHTLTTHPEPTLLRSNMYRVIAENVACGLDPEKVALYAQSDLPQVPELYLLLNSLAYLGELEKTTSFKDKARQQPENVNAGLLTYPSLMTADIIIHKATKVPVGKDQEQHLEMARTFANRFNHRYGNYFPEPYAFNYSSDLVKVPSLDGAGKMSKSENENATIYLSDSDDVIRKKVSKALTDGGPKETNSVKPDYIENLFLLMRLVSQEDTISFFEQSFSDCSIRYGDMKKQLAEDLVTFVAPIRDRAQSLIANERELQRILAQGADKARESAQKTIREVRSLMGISYY